MNCCKCHMEADRDFEQEEGSPNLSFVEGSFAPGLLVPRYERFDEYLYLNHDSTHILHQK
ncbi:uncharacterized protein EAE97_005164 [Botrytis byssoidea]|uniref:Uncharacterized protein n=1 Tax=Botrytis byssoidea TaxID=139641 RepID=A0A9P5IRD6_9HELO|nr:uncharacterized protein EAE97_005164 [Botrytis byssoidea]KAF7944531.1 hypothetical protein EAE97_005164 [Botrytis byssoidea]